MSSPRSRNDSRRSVLTSLCLILLGIGLCQISRRICGYWQHYRSHQIFMREQSRAGSSISEGLRIAEHGYPVSETGSCPAHPWFNMSGVTGLAIWDHWHWFHSRRYSDESADA